ncbi:MAG TPA: creatininase family protein [Alphaproteobacteria bacterium]|nr:creatininase family protein [Alphaproteobacteria bacterium]
MARLPRRLWEEMTTEEFRLLDGSRAIAVLPVAAIEQHGPHLPIAVDAVINAGILQRTLELLSPDLPVTVLPALPIGRSDEHRDYPGTLSLSPETIIRLWGEVADGVARAGLRKLAIFNSHGGQPQLVDIVGRELRIKHKMLVVQVNAYRLWNANGIFDEVEIAHGIHGGAIETSIMLHLRPDLVRVDKATNFLPRSIELAQRYRMIGAHGRVPYSWLAQDLNSAGACGDATKASAAHGRTLVEQAAQAFAEILAELDRLSLDTLKEPV